MGGCVAGVLTLFFILPGVCFVPSCIVLLFSSHCFAVCVHTLMRVKFFLKLRPNTVAANQRFFQASHWPTYAKKGSDNMAVGAAYVLAGCSLFFSVKGLAYLYLNINKK